MSVFVERRRKAEDLRVGTPRKNARLLGILGEKEGTWLKGRPRLVTQEP